MTKLLKCHLLLTHLTITPLSDDRVPFLLVSFANIHVALFLIMKYLRRVNEQLRNYPLYDTFMKNSQTMSLPLHARPSLICVCVCVFSVYFSHAEYQCPQLASSLPQTG